MLDLQILCMYASYQVELKIYYITIVIRDLGEVGVDKRYERTRQIARDHKFKGQPLVSQYLLHHHCGSWPQ